jgi:hypothetical protein
MSPLAITAVLIWFIVAPCSAIAQTANNNCPPGSTIYIDPRLAPQRPIVTREQYISHMPYMGTPEQNQYFENAYHMQNQPIQMPFKDGYVLIHPHNPCIQQYVGK